MHASPLSRAFLLSLAAALLATGGCAKEKQYAYSIDGQVLDADTGQPIVGAHVYYLYEGGSVPTSFSGHNSPDVCYHASAAVTDGAGRFHVDPWEQPRRYNVDNWEPTGWAYAPGYVPADLLPTGGVRLPPAPRPNDLYRLKKTQASGTARMDEIWRPVQWGCLHGGDSQRSLYPAFRAIYEEAKAISRTPEDKMTLGSIRAKTATVYVAPDPVNNSGDSEERMRKVIREELK